MKVLFLSRYQNSVERGAEVFVKELESRLSKNHMVDIFSSKKADSIKYILDGKYDVVVPVNGRLQSLKVSIAKLFGDYKVLITGHSGKGWDDIWNIAVAKPDIFVALTDAMARWAESWAWGSKVVRIPNGIDLTKFSPDGEKVKLDLPRPVILSVGALVWYKHHDRVIRAIKEIGYGSVLIVGEGEEKEKLEKFGRDLGKRFRIANFKYEDMPKIYRSADLFTLPSWDREAFGIVYLEALASGLGVVAPDDESRREIVGKAGLFTDINDSKAYAETIQKALSINWVKLARLQAEKFSWDKIAKEYEQLMLSII